MVVEFLTPLVSICIPTYEMKKMGVSFLTQLLAGIKIQTYRHIEVVISDHSQNYEIEDYCKSVRREFVDRGINLLYFRYELNRGNASANLNNSLKNASGSIIKIMFQDDMFNNSDTIEKIVKALHDNPDKKWGAVRFIHTNEQMNHYWNELKPLYSPTLIIGRNKLGCPSVIFFKRCEELFNENLRWLLDCEFYYRLYKKYGEPLIVDKNIEVVIRVWQNSLTYDIANEVKEAEEQYVLNYHKVPIEEYKRLKEQAWQEDQEVR
jgi:glycosyltransferase involved in cell wall biosynthesis